MLIINIVLYCARRARGARTEQSSTKMMTNFSENGYIPEFGFNNFNPWEVEKRKMSTHILTFGCFTDYGHPDIAIFQKFETFGLGQTNWAEILWGIWGISGQTISTILALWVPCPWESVAGSLSYKKLWFLGLKHTTPKYSQNKIWAVKNLGNNVRTSVFGGYIQSCVFVVKTAAEKQDSKHSSNAKKG